LTKYFKEHPHDNLPEFADKVLSLPAAFLVVLALFISADD
jgi:hypothetical protein